MGESVEYQNTWNKQEKVIIEKMRGIYQTAISKFPKNEELMRRYNNFLRGINDQENERALLNLALQLMPDKKSDVWKMFHEFEERCGNVQSMMEFEERHMTATIDENSSNDIHFTFLWVKDMFTFLDLKPYSAKDDMEYDTMENYYKNLGKDAQKDKQKHTTQSEGYDKLNQFINVLPLNYNGAKVNVDGLVDIFATMMDEL
ncbi:hypothetical protein EIN_252160 [Entamoeba invadens IP1]|uniref:Suppressor of forked domain-containing protein n=1 Tax=Entamoeba invadens IP1 TaxID=370355 RepID=A0A0A1UHB1_ENTIV|nr:hypothetical protein EIN_252160 [Entamoeba invadens IP1]ELP95012.1 hypothetical protein EIN_252160 [Entamoeba invadens IP1]|eukprot:XP_004261783.1 hypothetical protein EIN_252160 [Entamoeba invadens IP1]